jgi:uncharacterized protein YggE
MGDLLVRGRAEGRIPPSHAVLDVTVEAREPSSQQAALDRAAVACALVDGVVEQGRQGAEPLIRAAETSSIRTAEYWEYRPDGQRRQLGWTAERGTRIECAPDANGLTALVGALTHDDIRLSGPHWHVAADAAGWDALRTAAVTDARRRATAYAAGVDRNVGVVQWIAEPGLRRQPPGGPLEAFPAQAMSTVARARDSGGQDEPLAVRIAVEPVAVDITVEVGFDLA